MTRAAKEFHKEQLPINEHARMDLPWRADIRTKERIKAWTWSRIEKHLLKLLSNRSPLFVRHFAWLEYDRISLLQEYSQGNASSKLRADILKIDNAILRCVKEIDARLIVD